MNISNSYFIKLNNNLIIFKFQLYKNNDSFTLCVEEQVQLTNWFDPAFSRD